MFAALPKYLKIYRVSLTERLVYRADFFLGTILRFLPTVTTILLWEAIYAGSGKDRLGGFTQHEMIAYLLLVHISRMFSSMPGLAYGIARDIRDGSLKKYLLQPIDMIVYLVSYRGAHKTAYIATTALPYALLFFLFRDYFPAFPDALTLAGYVVSLLLAFLVGFFFEASLGMLGFWFLEVTSLLYIVGAVNFFVSGQMLPPDFLPQPWAGLLKALPFKYLAYFPAMVFLGKVRGWDLAYGLLVEVGWATAFIVLARLLYRWGLRHTALTGDDMGRYLRLLGALARYGLARELAFRGNMIAKVAVEVLWLAILLVFYLTVFQSTSNVAGWTEERYLFFVGCYFAMGGLVETFFLGNCNEFADLVRSGDLDFLLLKPIDEQFLVTCRSIDWSTAPNVLVGAAVMVVSLWRMHWDFDPLRLGLFFGMFLCGLGLAYGFLVLLTAASVWLVRNQSLYELWWLFSSLMRYPREIFQGRIVAPVGLFFSFVIPAMLVISVPADVMVRALNPRVIAFTAAATVVLLIVSRKTFRLALRRYRSASS